MCDGQRERNRIGTKGIKKKNDVRSGMSTDRATSTIRKTVVSRIVETAKTGGFCIDRERNLTGIYLQAF